jgi:hypothetical protein
MEPSNQWALGTVFIYIKRQELEADNLFSDNDKV